MAVAAKFQFLLVILCIVVQIHRSASMPRAPWINQTVFTESAQCRTDEELLDLCQRCAKLTKSKNALPSCCSNDLNARRWCSDYVYFGRGDYDFDKD